MPNKTNFLQICCAEEVRVTHDSNILHWNLSWAEILHDSNVLSSNVILIGASMKVENTRHRGNDPSLTRLDSTASLQTKNNIFFFGKIQSS